MTSFRIITKIIDEFETFGFVTCIVTKRTEVTFLTCLNARENEFTYDRENGRHSFECRLVVYIWLQFHLFIDSNIGCSLETFSMSKKDKQEITRVDFTKLPLAWREASEQHRLAQFFNPEDGMEMHTPMGDKLPRMKIVLNSGKELPKSGNAIRVKIGSTPPCSTSYSKKNPTWNEEFVVRLEPGNNPFYCVIQVPFSTLLWTNSSSLGSKRKAKIGLDCC